MHSRILCSSKRKWNTVFVEKAGLTGNHCVKWSKLDSEMQILYIFFHMWKPNLNSCTCTHTPCKTRKEEALYVTSRDGNRLCVAAKHTRGKRGNQVEGKEAWDGRLLGREANENDMLFLHPSSLPPFSLPPSCFPPFPFLLRKHIHVHPKILAWNLLRCILT